MDVTRFNFLEEYDNIIQAIEESDFLAIDAEFTGLSAMSQCNAMPLDTPAERYEKHRKGAADFLLIQYGLCTFRANEEKTMYEAKPYNFYVFQRPFSRNFPDRRFLCQSSSIDFLVSHDFDFNKMFKEGISYLTFEQESKLKLDLEHKHAASSLLSTSAFASPSGAGSKSGHASVPEDQKDFIEDVSNKISEFLANEDDAEPLILPPCCGFQRKLVYQTVEEKYPLAHVETKIGEKKERFIVITKAKDAEEARQQELLKQEFEMMELEHHVGFSKVMREIAKSNKLVIGHNMFLDVIHSMNQFFYPLPEDLDDFKMMLKSVFPRLADTKLMANTMPFKEHFMGSSLEDVYCTVKSPPFKPVQITLAEGFNKYTDGGVFHEAGYDAFITGCCFATMARFLGNINEPTAELLPSASSLVQPFINKLFLMRVTDIPYLNLDGPDLMGDREHILHLTFPREWRNSDLYQLFQPFGNIQISWLSDTTAYVCLFKKENAKQALEALSRQASLPFNVISYAEHHQSNVGTSIDKTATPSHIRSTPSAGVKREASVEKEMDPPSKKRKQSLTKNITESCHEEGKEELHLATPVKLGKNSALEKQVALLSGLEAERQSNKEKKNKEEQKLFEESETW